MSGAVILGLDSAEVAAALRLMGYSGKAGRAIYAGLCRIADVAVPILNEK